MLRNLRMRIESEEKGFTLIELLVVILIIGILAAIALPAFLGQQKKGQDADAKSNARNMVSQVESCFSNSQDYALCEATTQYADSGLNVVSGLGAVGDQQVGIEGGTSTSLSYTVVAQSKARTGATAHRFTIAHTEGSTPTNVRTCGPTDKGACPSTGNW